jgi:hypothetical protein
MRCVLDYLKAAANFLNARDTMDDHLKRRIPRELIGPPQAL